MPNQDTAPPAKQQARTVHPLTARPLVTGQAEREAAVKAAVEAERAKQRTKAPTDLLTHDEAAARLDVSDKTLRALVRDGSLRFITIGKGKQRPTYRFAPADLDRFIEQQSKQEAASWPSIKTRAHRPSTSTSSSSKVIAIADRLRSAASGKRKP